MKPIKPSDVVAKKKEIIPDEVIDSANELIALNWNGSSSTFTLKDLKKIIAEKITKNGKEINQDSINTKWLDIEPIYREEGWNVTYDSPSYGESYDSYFKFKK